MATLQDSTAQVATPELDYNQPVRLGRDSVFYRVGNRQPVAGLLAGVPALVLQVLHPAIGAGVYENSTLKSNPINRLRRTAEYVAGTAAAPDEDALTLIQRVHKRHTPVKGAHPTKGTPYSADDADLQIYVHVTEMKAILDAYKFLGGKLTPSEEDRYWLELKVIGAILGAPVDAVPETAAEAAAVIERMLPELEPTEQALDTIEFLLAPSGNRLFTTLKPFAPLNKFAAAAMLPDEIRRLIGLPTAKWLDPIVRASARVATTIGKPFFSWLTWKLVGPVAKRHYTAGAERTSQRAFTLPLPSPDAQRGRLS